MTDKTNTRRTIHTVVALAMTLTASSCAPAVSAAPQTANDVKDAGMAERCQAMNDKKEKMKEDMKADDAELAAQITLMNHATGEKRAELMAAVVSRIVEQRIAMGARKAAMEEEMMKHMMMHMKMGKDSAAKCPMMQNAKDPPVAMKTKGGASPHAGATPLASRN